MCGWGCGGSPQMLFWCKCDYKASQSIHKDTFASFRQAGTYMLLVILSFILTIKHSFYTPNVVLICLLSSYIGFKYPPPRELSQPTPPSSSG